MQVLLNGIISGLAIAVLALAFAVVHVPTRVFHIALGGIYAAVPFVAWACLQRGLSTLLAVMASVFIGVVLSLLCEMMNHWRLERKEAAPSAHLISSLGIYIIIVQVIALIWGNEARTLREGADAVFSLGDITLTRSQILVAGVSILLLVGFYIWLRVTNLGLQFRALAQNPSEFALRGYSVRRIRSLAFAISGLLVTATALLIANDTGFDPDAGLPALLLAVVAVIIGGQMSFEGAVLGGLILGVLQAEVVWLLSARWQEAVVFILLAAFLLARPLGILGRASRLEAQT